MGLHDKAIDDGVLEDINKMLDDILEGLKPYATPLTSDQKKRIPKLGEKNVSFMEKAYELSLAYEQFVPGHIDKKDFKEDYIDTHNIHQAENKARAIVNILNDIKTTAGSDAYRQALDYYNYLGVLEQRNVPGASAPRAELKKRFPGRSKSKSEEQGEEKEK